MRAWSLASSHPLVSFSIFLTWREGKADRQVSYRGQSLWSKCDRRLGHGAHGGGCAFSCRLWLPTRVRASCSSSIAAMWSKPIALPVPPSAYLVQAGGVLLSPHRQLAELAHCRGSSWIGR